MTQVVLSALYLLVALASRAELFSVPESLKPNVEFWTKIYTNYDSHQVIFFDDQDLSLIYAVLDLPKVPGEISSFKYRPQVIKRLKEIEKVLKDLSDGKEPGQKSKDYTTIRTMLETRKLLGKDDFSKRLRFQNGLKSQFSLGLKLSGLYVDDVTALLKSQGLPTELTALILVESLWFLSATSYAGASGLWGIVKETGLRSGIHINNFCDERLDPHLSTMAAASFLSKSKKGLGEWPLAITSYNYGYAGMLRASAALESKDISVIIANHESPIFKFASKNYYSEFLAALHVYQNERRYFPSVIKEKPWSYDLVQLVKPVLASDLYRVQAISAKDLSFLNPSLTELTLKGYEVIPAHYSLRVPKGKSEHFNESIKKIAHAQRNAAEVKISRRYRANGRENLLTIAKKFGIQLNFLTEKLNKLANYRPKGTVIIRSKAHQFSQLKDIHKNIETIKAPKEIAVGETPKPLKTD